MKALTSKTLGLAAVAVILSAGSAFAGDKKDCKNKTHASKATTTTMTTTATDAPTAVLSASETGKTKVKKTYTLEEATAKCSKKGAKDLQACIDYKMGKSSKS